MNRLLLIMIEGAPSSWHLAAGEVRERIVALDPADADLVQVWAIYRDHTQTHDVTEDYAADIAALAKTVVLPDFLRLARAI